MTAAVWDRGGLSVEQKIVLLVLADSANEMGEIIIIPAARVASDCSLPVQTVARIYDQLQETGLVVIDEQDPDLWRIDLAVLDRLPLTTDGKLRAARAVPLEPPGGAS